MHYTMLQTVIETVFLGFKKCHVQQTEQIYAKTMFQKITVKLPCL